MKTYLFCFLSILSFVLYYQFASAEGLMPLTVERNIYNDNFNTYENMRLTTGEPAHDQTEVLGTEQESRNAPYRQLTGGILTLIGSTTLAISLGALVTRPSGNEGPRTEVIAGEAAVLLSGLYLLHISDNHSGEIKKNAYGQIHIANHHGPYCLVLGFRF